MKKLISVIPMIAAFAVLVSLSGCKAQQQMQQQVSDMDAKMADVQRRVTTLDNDLKKANFEIGQLKSLVTKLGDVVVNLQKAEDERVKKAQEAAAVAATRKKPAPKPVAKKRKH